MDKDETIPVRLYKYRAFNNQALGMLVVDNLYYANPSTFNDPLDSRPSLDADLDEDELEKTLIMLVEHRKTAEMRDAAKAMKAEGPRTTEYIEQLSHREAVRSIEDIRYCATEPGFDLDPQEHKRFLLRDHIQEELLRRYEKGIVALAERADCPLMWSHYGDQHRGMCMGYSVPANTADYVRKVEYSGTRVVKASTVAAMLAGSEVARRQVDEVVLLRKAESWSYEQEWRLIGRRGVQASALELEEIVFGLKCEVVAKYIAMKVLEGRARPVKFFEMREDFETFKLGKKELTYDDGQFVHFPRRHLSALELFRSVADD